MSPLRIVRPVLLLLVGRAVYRLLSTSPALSAPLSRKWTNAKPEANCGIDPGRNFNPSLLRLAKLSNFNLTRVLLITLRDVKEVFAIR
jgi:hypothetical protein